MQNDQSITSAMYGPIIRTSVHGVYGFDHNAVCVGVHFGASSLATQQRDISDRGFA